MRIKKNGKVINLTEGDIKKLSKSLIKEQENTSWEAIQHMVNKKLGLDDINWGGGSAKEKVVSPSDKEHREHEEVDIEERFDELEEKIDKIITKLNVMETLR